MTEIQNAMEIIKKQEELLQFDHFNTDDAWELGCFIVNEMKERNICLTVAIRKLNGKVVFQYAPDGTTSSNINWMQKKFNTVSYLEKSSLLAGLDLISKGETLAVHGLKSSEYVGCGGGFPIRVKGTGIVMVLTVSELPHVEDHGFIVDCLAKYLNVEVPVYRDDLPMLGE